jgi:hypothetical protein
VPACRAAARRRRARACQVMRKARSSWQASSGRRERRVNPAPRSRVLSSAKPFSIGHR